MGWAILGGAALVAAPGPEIPSAWWQGKGAPKLTGFHRRGLSRRGTPYLDQQCFLEPGNLLREAPAGEDPLATLQQGRTWLAIRNRFLVGVGPASRGAIFVAQLKRCWPGGGDPMAHPEAVAFLAFLTRVVNVGDVVEYLYAPGGTVWVRIGREAPRAFRDLELVRAMLTLEFGFDAENPEAQAELREALRRRGAPAGP